MANPFPSPPLLTSDSICGRARTAALICALAALTACNSSTNGQTNVTVSGTVSGLAKGAEVVLSDNGASSLTVAANGPFTFSSPVTTGGSYDVAVTTQPNAQQCAVTNGSGADVTADVSNVSVVCSTESFTIGGAITGLPAGTKVVLDNSGADPLTLSADGSFTFATAVPYDGSYLVTVANQPAGESCTVSNGSGAAVTANITNVSVTCAIETFTVGGAVSGLVSGGQVTLKDNGGDSLTVSNNGPFTFSTPIAYGGSYAVTVGTQPTGQVCTVSGGSGSNVSYNVTSVAVTCATAAFSVTGTLSGLASGVQVTLYDNGADPLTLTANGAFQFSTPVAYGGGYVVTVATQPSGQSCLVDAGSGTNVTADVTGISVTCYQTTYATPGRYTWTVPSGVSSIQVVATGGGGGGGGMSGTSSGEPGGAGAIVTSTLSVTTGEILTFIVGGGGGSGASGPGSGGGYTCGAGGGGGGSTNVTGSGALVIAGGGGGGGGCENATAGGNGGEPSGAGGNGGAGEVATGGVGGSSGLGGAGGTDSMGDVSANGGNGSGGPGGVGGNNGSTYPGGTGGSGSGSGTGGNDNPNDDLSGGGGGGYGGGGSGVMSTGGGAGGSTGPAGSTYTPATNGGASATQGGDGSIVITIQ